MEGRLRFSSPERAIKFCFRLYCVLIAAIFVLLSATLLYTNSVTSHIGVSSLVRSQQILAHKIGAELQANIDESSPASVPLKVELQTDFAQFQSQNTILLSGRTNEGTFFEANFESDLQNLQPIFNQFEDFYSRILNSTNKKQAEDLGLKILEVQNEFSRKLGDAMHHYTVRKESWNTRNESILMLSGLFLSMIIVVHSVLVFAPSVKEVATLVKELSEVQVITEASRIELIKKNQQLVKQQGILEERQIELLDRKEELAFYSKASEASARRFEELFQSIPVACLGFDHEGLIYDWNRKSVETFGLEAYHVLQRPFWDFLFNSKHKPGGIEMTHGVFEGNSYQNLQLEYRCPDGKMKSLVMNVFPMYDINGRVSGGISAITDVSDRVRAEEQIRQSESTLRTVLDSMHEGLVVQDSNTVIKIANSNAPLILGLTEDELMGRSCMTTDWKAVNTEEQTMVPEDFPAFLAIEKKKPITNFQMGIRMNEGGIRWLSVNSVPLFDQSGSEVIGAVTSFSDMTDSIDYQTKLRKQVQLTSKSNLELHSKHTELRAVNQKLEALAITDGLTGLLNNRAFRDSLKAASANTSFNEYSLIILDVDHFKIFNDTFGHPAGDKVLRDVANILRNSSPADSVVARYGGEEFTILLPGADEKESRKIAKNIRLAVQNYQCELRNVTVSVGISTEKSSQMEELGLDRADKALYTSKNKGRNCVTHWVELTAERRRAA